MVIAFIGNFQHGPGGEAADETHLVRELEKQGHTVYQVPRDEWREYVRENFPIDKYKVPENVKADAVLIAKWHHFFDGRFIIAARSHFQAPVFYWVWDNMEGHTPGDWHLNMAKEADLYLSGELGLAQWYRSQDVKFYYFQFDSTDGDFPSLQAHHKEYDVVFLGSCTNQNGRLDLLKAINEKVKIQVFGYDYEEWRKQGFAAEPAVYGFEFNKIVAKSKIILGTSAGPNIFGYWSNRVGKVLYAEGFLLQWYTPGMELFLADSCEYFSTAEEAVAKITFYLQNPERIRKFFDRNRRLGRERWTSEFKVRQLLVLIDRYKKTPEERRQAWLLP